MTGPDLTDRVVNPTMTRYCSECGTPLVPDAEPSSYNVFSGRPFWRGSCPNARKRSWWQRVFFDDYDEHDRSVGL